MPRTSKNIISHFLQTALMPVFVICCIHNCILPPKWILDFLLSSVQNNFNVHCKSVLTPSMPLAEKGKTISINFPFPCFPHLSLSFLAVILFACKWCNIMGYDITITLPNLLWEDIIKDLTYFTILIEKASKHTLWYISIHTTVFALASLFYQWSVPQKLVSLLLERR